MKELKKKFIGLFTLCLILLIINGIILNLVNEWFFQYSNSYNFEESSIQGKLFLVLIFAPFIESYLFTYLPYYVFSNFEFSEKQLIIIFSLLFSLIHLYHPLYVIMAFNAGLIINWFYIYSTKHTKHPLLAIIILHSLFNLIVFCFSE